MDLLGRRADFLGGRCTVKNREVGKCRANVYISKCKTKIMV